MEEIYNTENYIENIENEVDFNETDLSSELNNLEIEEEEEEEPNEIARDSFSPPVRALSLTNMKYFDLNEKDHQEISFQNNDINNSEDIEYPNFELNNTSPIDSYEYIYQNTKTTKRNSSKSNDSKSSSGLSSLELTPPLSLTESIENIISPNTNKTQEISFLSNDSQNSKYSELPPCDVSPIRTVNIYISHSTTPLSEKKKNKQKKSIKSKKNTSFEVQQNIISDDSFSSPISSSNTNNDSSIISLENYYSDIPIW